MFALWFHNVLKTMGKRKKQDDIFLRKKTEEKQNSPTITISVDGKVTAYSVNLKLEGNRLNKDSEKENFKKDLMNLIETNH